MLHLVITKGSTSEYNTRVFEIKVSGKCLLVFHVCEEKTKQNKTFTNLYIFIYISLHVSRDVTLIRIRPRSVVDSDMPVADDCRVWSLYVW